MNKSYNQDKTDWMRGPWDDEPDEARWVDAATGYDCLITRNSQGVLCGYVVLLPGHRYYRATNGRLTAKAEKLKHDSSIDWLDCHGGVNFTRHRACDIWWLVKREVEKLAKQLEERNVTAE